MLKLDQDTREVFKWDETQGGVKMGPRHEGGVKVGPRHKGGVKVGPRHEGGVKVGPRHEGGSGKLRTLDCVRGQTGRSCRHG